MCRLSLKTAATADSIDSKVILLTVHTCLRVGGQPLDRWGQVPYFLADPGVRMLVTRCNGCFFLCTSPCAYMQKSFKEDREELDTYLLATDSCRTPSCALVAQRRKLAVVVPPEERVKPHAAGPHITGLVKQIQSPPVRTKGNQPKPKTS